MKKKVQDTSNRKSDSPTFSLDTDGMLRLRNECLVLLQTMGNLSVVVTGLIVLLGKEIDESYAKSTGISATELAQHIMPSVFALYDSAKDMGKVLKSSDGLSPDSKSGRTSKSHKR